MTKIILSTLVLLSASGLLVYSEDAYQYSPKGESYRGTQTVNQQSYVYSQPQIYQSQPQQQVYQQSGAYQYQQQQQQLRPIGQQQSVPSRNTVNYQYQNQQQAIPQRPYSSPSRLNAHEQQSDDPDQTGVINDLTTRKPGKNSLPAPNLPRPTPVSRFDSFDKIKLNWDEEMTKNNEIFSLKLFGILTYMEEENFMISPYSIHSLLVTIAEGAEGETYDELNNSLGLVNLSKTRNFHQYINAALNKSAAEVVLRQFATLVNDINRPASREYEDIVEKIYDVELLPVNFKDVDETLNKINSKVYEQTAGQIRDAVERDDILKAQLILMSGIYFQGNWKSVFNKTFTKKEKFFDITGTNEMGEVNMMFQRGTFPFATIKELESYVVELPYGSNQELASRNQEIYEDRISMIVVLPRKGLPLFNATDNIHKFGMDSIFRELLKAARDYPDEETEVHIPRFEIDTSVNLIEALENLGIKSLFKTEANLNKINKNYYISSILHKTKIRVDEKGTEAAAVTTAFFANKSTPPKFHANRPFLYFIVDKATRLILFSGVYRKPSVF